MLLRVKQNKTKNCKKKTMKWSETLIIHIFDSVSICSSENHWFIRDDNAEVAVRLLLEPHSGRLDEQEVSDDDGGSGRGHGDHDDDGDHVLQRIQKWLRNRN